MHIMWRDRTVGAVRLGKRAEGFTLIEVLVGAMLLLIAMAGLVPFFLSGLSQSASVRYKSTANNIAREKMEELRQYDYRDITDALLPSDEFPVTEEVRGIVYNIDYEVAEVEYELGVLKEVSVEVGWDAPPKVSPVRLTSLMHQQYVGALIDMLEAGWDDVTGDKLSDFDQLNENWEFELFCYIAEQDWKEVTDMKNFDPEVTNPPLNTYTYVNDEGETVTDTAHMKLAIVDEDGVPVMDIDEEITDLVYEKSANLLYFRYSMNSADLPDGYWEFQAQVFNEFNEARNTASLTLRVENGPPDAPSDLTCTVPASNDSVELYWEGTSHTDRAYYSIQYRYATWDSKKTVWTTWTGWTPTKAPYIVPVDLEGQPDPDATSYVHEVGTSPDYRVYQYRIRAVDIDTPANDGAWLQMVGDPINDDLPSVPPYPDTFIFPNTDFTFPADLVGIDNDGDEYVIVRPAP